MSEEKFEFEVMFCGRPAQLGRFVKGIWAPVTEEEAKEFSVKLDWRVRDSKGNLLDGAYFQAQDEKQQQEAMRIYAIKEREAERVSSRTSLKPNAQQHGPVPHDEGYVPQEGALDASDLPPAGFEYVEGAPRKAYKGVIASQRFDSSQAQEISTLRLSPKDDPAAVLNVSASLAATRVDLAGQLAKTPIRQISRA